MSPAFKKEHGEIRLQLPERLREKTIKEVRIHPKSNGRFFEIEYVYEQQKQPQNLDYTKALAIDMVSSNLYCFTITDTTGYTYPLYISLNAKQS
jgi:transposase